MLADYAFSMMFFKAFFEIDGAVCIPVSEDEWKQLWNKKTADENLEKVTSGLYNGTEVTRTIIGPNLS